MKILIVDDNDDERLLLRRIIEKDGYTAFEAHDGLDALEIARTRKPNLIISDISMPRMDGFQLLRTAKQDNALKSIPFIFYSAIYAGNREKEIATLLGAVSFIEKCTDIHEGWNALKGFIETGISKSVQGAEKILNDDDEEFLRRYNTLVISKLEEKVRELERESAKDKQLRLMIGGEQNICSDLKQAEEQLNLTNEELRVGNDKFVMPEETLKGVQIILNSMGDGVVLTDKGGRFLFVNPAAEKILGAGVKDVTAYTWSDYYAFYKPDMKTPYHADELPLSKALRGESVTMADVFVRFIKETKSLWVSVTACPLKDKYGVLKGGVAVIRDITERIRATEAIRRHHQELQTILDACPAMIFYKDTENRLIRVNRTLADVMGLPVEQIEGKSAVETYPNQAEKYWRDDKEVMSTGKPKMHIIEPLETTKGIRWIQTDKFPFFDENGNIRGVIGFAIDITERRQAEERLAESETQFRTIMETASDAIICLKNPGIIHLWNKKAEKMFGYTRKEANGKDMHALIVPERYREKACQGLEGFFQTGEGHVIGKTLEVYALRKDGSEFPIEITVSAMQIKGEWMASGIVREISERKQAEDKFKKLAHQNELILNSVIEGIYGIDLQGNVTFVNQAALKMLGWTSEEIIGKHAHSILHHSKPDGTLYCSEECLIYEVLKTGCINQTENEVFWRKDGTKFPIYYTSTPVLENDKIVGAVVTFGDITERRKNEHRLAAQHEATKILAEVDTVKDAFPKILQTICEGIEWEYGEIWLADEQNNVLRCAELWHLPSVNMAEFIAMTRTLVLNPGDSCPGKVWTSGKSLWISDITLYQECIRMAVALKENVHSAFYFPVVSDNRILGVMGFCSNRVRDDEEDTIRRIYAVGRQIGMFLLRKRAEERARIQMQHLMALRDIDKAIVSSLDLNVTIDVFLDRAFQQLNVDAIDVLLFDPYMQVLRYAGGRGFITAQIQHTRIHLSEDVTGVSLLENHPVCIPDVNNSDKIIIRKEMFVRESFVAYYCMPLTAKGHMKGVIEVYYRKPIHHEQEWMDFLETLAGQAAIAIDNATLFKDLRRSNIELTMAYDSTIEGWAHALDLRDRETEGHSRRVTEMTVEVAKIIGLSAESDLIHIRRGALLHDIGKMGIPDGILLKDKPLNEEEWAVMKKHPIYSYNLLSPIAYLHQAIDIPYCHHEKWDGTGYPRGLKGEQIPLAARIFAVVDVWDAMRSDRPYRKGIPAEEVRDHIRSLAGTHFDPKVVEAFLRMDVS